MSEVEFQVIKAIGFVGAFFAALALQRLRPHAGAPGSWRLNGGLWAINLVVLGIVCAGCACTVARWAEAEGIGLFNRVAIGAWWTLPASVLLLDAVSYAWHRANHRISWLWRFHQIHHSDPAFTATTGLRFHFGELLLALPVRLSAVALLGISISSIIVFELVFAFATFIEHADLDLPLAVEERLGRVFITPALHRRHHGRESRLLNSNYGTIFSFWDRSLRSFGPSSSAVRIEPGLPGVARDPGAVDVLSMPFRMVLRGR